MLPHCFPIVSQYWWLYITLNHNFSCFLNVEINKFPSFPPQYCTNNTMCLVCLVIEKNDTTGMNHHFSNDSLPIFTGELHQALLGTPLPRWCWASRPSPLGKEIQGLFAFAGHVLLWCWKANTWDHHETLKTKGKHNSITGWLYIYNIMWIIMRCHGIQNIYNGNHNVYIYIYVCVHNLGGPSKPRSPLLNHNLNMIELHM